MSLEQQTLWHRSAKRSPAALKRSTDISAAEEYTERRIRSLEDRARELLDEAPASAARPARNDKSRRSRSASPTSTAVLNLLHGDAGRVATSKSDEGDKGRQQEVSGAPARARSRDWDHPPRSFSVMTGSSSITPSSDWQEMFGDLDEMTSFSKREAKGEQDLGETRDLFAEVRARRVSRRRGRGHTMPPSLGEEKLLQRTSRESESGGDDDRMSCQSSF